MQFVDAEFVGSGFLGRWSADRMSFFHGSPNLPRKKLIEAKPSRIPHVHVPFALLLLAILVRVYIYILLQICHPFCMRC
jgi:hypothetical protein